MFIKLTNSVDRFKGNPIHINVDQIAALYEVAKEEGGSLTTVIYGGPTGIAWEVEESLSEVLQKINEAKG